MVVRIAAACVVYVVLVIFPLLWTSAALVDRADLMRQLQDLGVDSVVAGTVVDVACTVLEGVVVPKRSASGVEGNGVEVDSTIVVVVVREDVHGTAEDNVRRKDYGLESVLVVAACTEGSRSAASTDV